MTRTPLDDVAELVKDATYVSVGLGVIAFQRLQVRRAELTKVLSEHGDGATGAVGAVADLVGDRLKMVEERLGATRAHR